MKKRLGTLMVVFAMVAVLAVPVFAAPPGPTIVDVAVAANAPGGEYEGLFDCLIAAVVGTGLDAPLSGNGHFTVFAPIDPAFEALGLDCSSATAAEDSATFLVETYGQDAVTEILLYHVARGNREASAVTNSNRIRTLQGSFLFVDGTILTDQVGRNANIIVPDVTAPSNGVIHAIDLVVLPFALP